ncbi:MAG: stage II sporulation protein P [Clostridiales bacterium]|nr:stage II sporulation protein P [Clostridiales bacterium]
MLNITKKRLRKQKRGKHTVILLCAGMTVFFCFLTGLTIKNQMAMHRLSSDLCCLILKQISPNLSQGAMSWYYEDETSGTSYETRSESSLIYENILAQNVSEETVAEAGAVSENATEENVGESGTEETSAASSSVVSLEKLNDFDYLIQNFYTVDSTTTINSSQLNAQELLNIDCSIEKRTDKEPQILIYHTHASEGYSDSAAGDYSETVVGVGERLTEILENTYGYQVLHDTGVYDKDRDRAYSVAEPYVEQILAENPSIEIVIDLHRDGVADSTRLVTEQNGVQMAQIMFFNGLSRTTSMGDIAYLANPYITDNLAFSLQMQLAAAELYPGFSRKIYLKGYRYNMHLMPKSLLVEVGAQTNTLEEAMNAMEPLAAILDHVLSVK